MSPLSPQGLTPLGTLEEWVSTYGAELDEDTWRRCRAARRLLREAAARGGDAGTWGHPVRGGPMGLRVSLPPAAPAQDSQVFDAEVTESQMAPGDGDGDSDGDMSPLWPVKKRQQALEEPDEFGAAVRGLGSAKSLPGATKSLPGAPVSLGATVSLSATKSPPSTAVPSPRPALIPAEQYLAQEDWLVDDLGGTRGGRKRPRRDPQEPVTSSGDSTGTESDGADPPAPRRRRAGQRGPSRERGPPEGSRDPLPTDGGGEGSPSDLPVSPPAPPPVSLPVSLPAPLPALRVRVRVQDNVFLIPVPQR